MKEVDIAQAIVIMRLACKKCLQDTHDLRKLNSVAEEAEVPYMPKCSTHSLSIDKSLR